MNERSKIWRDRKVTLSRVVSGGLPTRCGGRAYCTELKCLYTGDLECYWVSGLTHRDSDVFGLLWVWQSASLGSVPYNSYGGQALTFKNIPLNFMHFERLKENYFKDEQRGGSSCRLLFC